MHIKWGNKPFSDDISDHLYIVYDYLALLKRNLKKFSQLSKMKKEADNEADNERKLLEEQRMKLWWEQRNEQIKLIKEQITSLSLLKDYSYYCIEQQDSRDKFGADFRLVIKMSEMINIVVSPKYDQSISRPVKVITQILEILKLSESLENKVEILKEILKNRSIA